MKRVLSEHIIIVEAADVNAAVSRKARKLKTDIAANAAKEPIMNAGDQTHSLSPPDIFMVPSVHPSFKGQTTLTTEGPVDLDSENKIVLIQDFLSAEELTNFIAAAVNVPRQTGKSAFNSIKPRREVCYTVDGKPYKYSGRKHATICFPPHVTDLLLPKCMCALEKYLPGNRFQKLSNGVDILYGSEFSRGGSIGAHSDDEMPWGLVVIFSLGQTRWLRVRSKSDRRWVNIEARHNSVIAMYGDTFQTKYTHQVDKLSESEPVHNRLSLNIRFLEGASTDV